MSVLPASAYLSDVKGLKNDIVFKVFTCPDCRTDLTISRWQAQGDFPILCARCNHRHKIQGDSLLAMDAVATFELESWENGKPSRLGQGFKVFAGLDATQKAAPVPKDSFLLVMKPELAPPPKPAAPPAA